MSPRKITKSEVELVKLYLLLNFKAKPHKVEFDEKCGYQFCINHEDPEVSKNIPQINSFLYFVTSIFNNFGFMSGPLTNKPFNAEEPINDQKYLNMIEQIKVKNQVVLSETTLTTTVVLVKEIVKSINQSTNVLKEFNKTGNIEIYTSVGNVLWVSLFINQSNITLACTDETYQAIHIKNKNIKDIQGSKDIRNYLSLLIC